MAHSSEGEDEDEADRKRNEFNALVREALEERERLLAEREALLKERARLLKRSKGGKKRSSGSGS
jgi:hypothetical protein